jgi:hypothetical protein
MHKPKDYIWIERWGQYSGSHERFIKMEQDRAAKENAPLTAIFQGGGRDPLDKTWHTIESVTNEATRQHLRKTWPDEDYSFWK